MEEWRRKAFDMFPNLHEDLEDDDSIYGLFFELLPQCVEAHQKGNDEKLKRIYAYAKWCLRHEDREVWNAACVAFYEHLVDCSITREAISRWLEPEEFCSVSGLFEFRLGNEEYTELLKEYFSQHEDCLSLSMTLSSFSSPDFSI